MKNRFSTSLLLSMFFFSNLTLGMQVIRRKRKQVADLVDKAISQKQKEIIPSKIKELFNSTEAKVEEIAFKGKIKLRKALVDAELNRLTEGLTARINQLTLKKWSDEFNLLAKDVQQAKNFKELGNLALQASESRKKVDLLEGSEGLYEKLLQPAFEKRKNELKSALDEQLNKKKQIFLDKINMVKTKEELTPIFQELMTTGEILFELRLDVDKVNFLAGLAKKEKEFGQLKQKLDTVEKIVNAALSKKIDEFNFAKAEKEKLFRSNFEAVLKEGQNLETKMKQEQIRENVEVVRTAIETIDFLQMKITKAIEIAEKFNTDLANLVGKKNEEINENKNKIKALKANIKKTKKKKFDEAKKALGKIIEKYKKDLKHVVLFAKEAETEKDFEVHKDMYNQTRRDYKATLEVYKMVASAQEEEEEEEDLTTFFKEAKKSLVLWKDKRNERKQKEQEEQKQLEKKEKEKQQKQAKELIEQAEELEKQYQKTQDLKKLEVLDENWLSLLEKMKVNPEIPNKTVGEWQKVHFFEIIFGRLNLAIEKDNMKIFTKGTKNELSFLAEFIRKARKFLNKKIEITNPVKKEERKKELKTRLGNFLVKKIEKTIKALATLKSKRAAELQITELTNVIAEGLVQAEGIIPEKKRKEFLQKFKNLINLSSKKN